MDFTSQKPNFWLLFFIELCAIAFCFANEDAWLFAPVVQIVALAILFLLGELGRFPYGGRHRVVAAVPFFLYLLPMTLLTSTLADAPAHPLYPTDFPQLWAALPFAAFGIASVLRGFRWQ
jgi:hypothetical protein